MSTDTTDAITVTVPLRITRAALTDCVGSACTYCGYWAREVADAEHLTDAWHVTDNDIDGTTYTVYLNDIAHAIGNIIAGNVAISFEYVGYIHEGIAGHGWSADAADIVLQVATFGEIVYG